MKKARRKAISAGKLFEKYDCYVLDGGDRVLSKRAAVRLLSSGRESGNLDAYIAALPSRYDGLAAGANLEFVLPGGRVGHGIEAHTLINICAAYLESRSRGELRRNQFHLADAAGLFIANVAQVGIIALIDEATGYEAVRERGELQKVFRDALGAWELTFTPDLVQYLCRLGIAGERYKGWSYGMYPRPLASAFRRIYDLILGPSAAKLLKQRNPEPSKGRNHHQWLTAEAHDLLCKNMGIIRFCARTSSSREEFWGRLTDHYSGQSRLVFGGSK